MGRLYYPLSCFLCLCTCNYVCFGNFSMVIVFTFGKNTIKQSTWQSMWRKWGGSEKGWSENEVLFDYLLNICLHSFSNSDEASAVMKKSCDEVWNMMEWVDEVMWMQTVCMVNGWSMRMIDEDDGQIDGTMDDGRGWVRKRRMVVK